MNRQKTILISVYCGIGLFLVFGVFQATRKAPVALSRALLADNSDNVLLVDNSGGDTGTGSCTMREDGTVTSSETVCVVCEVKGEYGWSIINTNASPQCMTKANNREATR